MRKHLLVAGAAWAAGLLSAHAAAAHAVAGNRFFPATLATDDPGVADELSLPTASWLRTGDEPSERQPDISGEYSKRLTDRLGVSVETTWTRLQTPGEPAVRGFQNLETTVKYQVLTNREHEAIVSAGVSYEWSGTGANRVGAEDHSTVAPTIWFGKGFGDLPDSLAWARPFAVTGVAAYEAPTRAREDDERIPKVATYGVAIEYSLPYLAAHVRDLGMPEAMNHITPLVEAVFETPVLKRGEERMTGTINPGLIWSGRYFQVSAEATLPINRDSGRGAGFIIQMHFYLDDLFPRTIGKPIW